MKSTFTCDHCGQTFSTEQTEEEVAVESQKNWGTTKAKDPTMAVLCDVCYRKLMIWWNSKQN